MKTKHDLAFRRFEIIIRKNYYKRLKILADDLISNATPPIKGEITKGKLKWRGIALTVYPEGQYLTQRGERISRIV